MTKKNGRKRKSFGHSVLLHIMVQLLNGGDFIVAKMKDEKVLGFKQEEIGT